MPALAKHVCGDSLPAGYQRGAPSRARSLWWSGRFSREIVLRPGVIGPLAASAALRKTAGTLMPEPSTGCLTLRFPATQLTLLESNYGRLSGPPRKAGPTTTDQDSGGGQPGKSRREVLPIY